MREETVGSPGNKLRAGYFATNSIRVCRSHFRLMRVQCVPYNDAGWWC